MAEAVLASIKLILTDEGHVALSLETVDNNQLIGVMNNSNTELCTGTVAGIHRQFIRSFDSVAEEIEEAIAFL